MDLERAVLLINEKQLADAPIGFFDELPVTKGKGRFGPFIKWNDLYINIPRAYNFDNLSQSDINELIEKKIDKEANRFIRQWPAEKISIENGRWGAFIRYQKKMLKLGKKADGTKFTPEELTTVELDEIKKMIEQQVPGALTKKVKAPTKKSASANKKSPAKKSVKKAIKKK
jgi:DNA topoisomerase-1